MVLQGDEALVDADSVHLIYSANLDAR
jgi:hypothetical protein